MALRSARSHDQRSRGDTQRALDEFDELAGLRGAGGAADQDRTVYVLEHLATFTVTRETGIVYPADGMRRLLQLEKTNGESDFPFYSKYEIPNRTSTRSLICRLKVAADQVRTVYLGALGHAYYDGDSVTGRWHETTYGCFKTTTSAVGLHRFN